MGFIQIVRFLAVSVIHPSHCTRAHLTTCQSVISGVRVCFAIFMYSLLVGYISVHLHDKKLRSVVKPIDRTIHWNHFHLNHKLYEYNYSCTEYCHQLNVKDETIAIIKLHP